MKQQQTLNWTKFANNLNHKDEQQESFPSCTQMHNKIKLIRSDHSGQHNPLIHTSQHTHQQLRQHKPPTTYTRKIITQKKHFPLDNAYKPVTQTNKQHHL